jgi:hypothetical protein
MNTYERADELVKQGFFVFPSQSKSSHMFGWSRLASNNPQRIKDWFHSGAAYASWRVSIFTGRYGANEALIAADVDPKNGGLDTIKALEKANPCAFPDTREHSTPSGGVHVLYRVPWPGVKSGTHTLGRGIDVRSAGALIHFGDKYSLSADAPVALAPDWLVAKCTRASVGKPADRAADVLDPDQDRAWQQATKIFEAWPRIDEGQRNLELYKFICRVRETAATDDATTLAIGLEFCDRCTPPFDHGEGERTIRSAIKTMQSAAGSKSDVPEVRQAAAKKEFEAVEDQPANEAKTQKAVILPFDHNISRVGDCFTHEPERPRFVVDSFLPMAVGQENSPGGAGKTTRQAWESIHIIIGRLLYGRAILKQGPVLIATKEDGMDIFKYRLHQVAKAMDLSDAEQKLLAQHFHVLDLTGEVGGRLVEVDRMGIYAPRI